MADKNRVSIPSGMGGLTRYFDDYSSKIEIKPGHVILMAVLVMAIVIFLHLQGNAILGLG